ncbi:MAG: efflux RND transporter periplasmic adaptor subunit [Myxococcota bacterium]
MNRRRVSWILGVLAAAVVAALWAGSRFGVLGFFDLDVPVSDSDSAESVPPRVPLAAVAALGRLEPHRGVIRVAGPPRPAVVIKELRVEEGDRIEKNQVLAILAGAAVERAEVARLRAELANAERELERNRKLRRDRVLSESDWQALELARDVARASLQRAEADLELSTVRSPIEGQVLEIQAREGERVGPEGIAEVGRTHAMIAVAEVYETDIGRVRVGQRARIHSPALPHALEGEVERIGLKIGKKDVLSTDPVADADARVVEVEIRLLEPALAARLTNLRVDVVIEP